jgi:hypothetical protein
MVLQLAGAVLFCYHCLLRFLSLVSFLQEAPTMSSHHTHRTLAGLMTALALSGFAWAEDKPAAPPDRPVERASLTLRLSGPYVHDNLAVYLIHGSGPMKGRKLLTLDEALEQKKVVVHETKNVNELAIDNNSTEEVFIQAGDIVKGGKQDRLIAMDLLVPAKASKVPLAAFCVERGRWGKRGAPTGNCFEDEEEESFSRSAAQVPSRGLKIAARSARSQAEVWENVAKAQAKLSASVGGSVKAAKSESSLQLTLEHEKLVAALAACEKALVGCVEGKDDVIGLAIAVNGTMDSADVYGSHELFLKLWPKLLRASAVEALAEREKGKKLEAPRLEAVQAWLADAEQGKRSDKTVNQRLAEVRLESDRSVLFETVDREQKGACLRRSYVAK